MDPLKAIANLALQTLVSSVLVSCLDADPPDTNGGARTSPSGDAALSARSRTVIGRVREITRCTILSPDNPNQLLTEPNELGDSPAWAPMFMIDMEVQSEHGPDDDTAFVSYIAPDRSGSLGNTVGRAVNASETVLFARHMPEQFSQPPGATVDCLDTVLTAGSVHDILIPSEDRDYSIEEFLEALDEIEPENVVTRASISEFVLTEHYCGNEDSACAQGQQ